MKLQNRLSDKWFDEVWMPDRDTANLRINPSLTPTYSYTRADCPQYGELKGPSCYTAPLVAVRPDLPQDLLPQNYQPRPISRPCRNRGGPQRKSGGSRPPYINPTRTLSIRILRYRWNGAGSTGSGISEPGQSGDPTAGRAVPPAPWPVPVTRFPTPSGELPVMGPRYWRRPHPRATAET